MSIGATTLRKLAALDLSAEQMAGVLDILADQAQVEEDRRAAQRDRTRRHRAKRDGNVTDTSQPCYTPPNKESPPTPPKEINPPRVVSSPARERFPEFWSLYPHKVGKRDAEKAFSKAIKRAPFEAIMAGLRRYAAKTDDRPWCNPATWLNQDRWDDAPAEMPTPNARGSPPKQGKTIDDVYRERGWLSTDEPDFHTTIDADYTADGDADDPSAFHGLAAAAWSRR